VSVINNSSVINIYLDKMESEGLQKKKCFIDDVMKDLMKSNRLQQKKKLMNDSVSDDLMNDSNITQDPFRSVHIDQAYRTKVICF